MNWKRFFSFLTIGILLVAMMAPAGSEAARKKGKKATTSATTKSKKSTPTRVNRRPKAERSVTQATQEAAIQASGRKETAPAATASAKKPATGDKKKSGGSALMKITVDKPDLEEIRIATLDPSNKYYFPKLMAKYQRNDTTMTADEYRYFYLGYMFQEDYDPYRMSPYSGVTDSLRLKASHTKEEIDTIRKYAEKALLDNPFDLRQMSFLVHVLKERRKDMSAKIWEYRLEHLLGAIKSTGTGEDVENAWYVIYPMHEYDMVQLLGYEAVDVDYIDPGYDYLMVEPDGTIKHRSPAKGFYFNVQVPQQQYELKHPEDEESEGLGADGEEDNYQE